MCLVASQAAYLSLSSPHLMTALLPTYILDPHSVAVSQFKNVDRVLFIHHLYLGYLRYGSSRVCNEAMIVDGDYFRLFPETVRI